MELSSHLHLIWASKRWLALFAVVAAVIVYGISSSRTDQYESKALGQIVSTSQVSGEILSEEQLLSLSNVYHELAKTRTVLELAHEDPAVKERASEFDLSVKVEPEARTGVLSFRATTGDPDQSAAFANAYANAFASYLNGLQVNQLKTTLQPIQQRIEQINKELATLPAGDPNAAGLQVELQALQNEIATQTANPGDTMRVVERAVPSSSPVSPRPLRDGLLALIGALVLGASAIYLRDIFFDRYRSAQEVARDLGLPLLGEIPKGQSTGTLEAFRSLRTAVVFALERSRNSEANDGGTSLRAGTVLITGAESGCGKSYVAANVSRALATEGRQVIAVDGDLRRPTLHDVFGVRLSPGLSDLLVGESAPHPSEIAARVPLPPSSSGSTGGLRLMPAGDHSSDSVEWLSSEKMKAIVRYLQSNSDAVVFDSPPTQVVVDPVVLARYADGVVFVVDSRRTRRRDARRAIEALRATGAPLLGLAFNRSQSRQARYDAYRPREPRQAVRQPRETRV